MSVIIRSSRLTACSYVHSLLWPSLLPLLSGSSGIHHPALTKSITPQLPHTQKIKWILPQGHCFPYFPFIWWLFFPFIFWTWRWGRYPFNQTFLYSSSATFTCLLSSFTSLEFNHQFTSCYEYTLVSPHDSFPLSLCLTCLAKLKSAKYNSLPTLYLHPWPYIDRDKTQLHQLMSLNFMTTDLKWAFKAAWQSTLYVLPWLIHFSTLSKSPTLPLWTSPLASYFTEKILNNQQKILATTFTHQPSEVT